MQLVAGSSGRISGGVAQAGSRVLAKGRALDGMQLLCGIIPQHQPPPVLLDLYSPHSIANSQSKGLQRHAPEALG